MTTEQTKAYCVLYVTPGLAPSAPPLVFKTSAPDDGAARADCVRQHTEADIVWVVQTGDEADALSDYYNFGLPH